MKFLNGISAILPTFKMSHLLLHVLTAMKQEMLATCCAKCETSLAPALFPYYYRIVGLSFS